MVSSVIENFQTENQLTLLQFEMISMTIFSVTSTLQ